MKWLILSLAVLAGCVVPDEGGDLDDLDVSPEPAAQAMRDYVRGVAREWRAEADRLELDPSRADRISGETIKRETERVRLEAQRPINEAMNGGVTPAKLRTFADQAEGVLR